MLRGALLLLLPSASLPDSLLARAAVFPFTCLSCPPKPVRGPSELIVCGVLLFLLRRPFRKAV